jgi:hypothetical protein
VTHDYNGREKKDVIKDLNLRLSLKRQSSRLSLPQMVVRLCELISMDMAMSSLLDLQPTLSHSAYSFAPSTPTSSGDFQLIPPKSERRISLGVLNSTKFRLSHDVRSRARALLTFPSYPHSCLTRVVRMPFFSSLHVSSGRPVLSLQSQLKRAEQP